MINSVIVSSQPDRHTVFSSRHVYEFSTECWRTTVWEAQRSSVVLILLLCLSNNSRASSNTQKEKKGKQDGGEIIKHEDERAEAGETGIRVPRLAPGIWQHRQQKSSNSRKKTLELGEVCAPGVNLLLSV